MSIEFNAEIGNRIRAYRKELGLTREAFADKSGISPQFLAEIEFGRKGISAETLQKICVAFRVSSDYFLFGKPNMNLGSPANCLLDNVPNKYIDEYMTIIGMLNTLVKKSADEKQE